LLLALMALLCLNGLTAPSAGARTPAGAPALPQAGPGPRYIPGTIQFRPTIAYVSPGGTVTVEVWLQDVGGIYGLDLRFDFDKDLVSVPSGNVTPLWDVFDSANHFFVGNSANNSTGKVLYAVVNTEPAVPFTGTGRVCSVTFSGLEEGTAALTWTSVTGSDRPRPRTPPPTRR
jgi:hypothetical protein